MTIRVRATMWSLAMVSCTGVLTADEPEEPAPPSEARPATIPPDADTPVVAAEVDTTRVVAKEHEPRAPAPGIPADARIEMERGPCYGRCPVYRVVLRADGEVQWHGKRFVETKGDAAGAITPAAFAELWRSMNETELAKLPHDFPHYPSEHCPSYFTDASTAVVVVAGGGGDHRVSDYHGCSENARLDAFRELERRIDEVAGSEGWIGRCRTEPCKP